MLDAIGFATQLQLSSIIGHKPRAALARAPLPSAVRHAVLRLPLRPLGAPLRLTPPAPPMGDAVERNTHFRRRHGAALVLAAFPSPVRGAVLVAFRGLGAPLVLAAGAPAVTLAEVRGADGRLGATLQLAAMAAT
eukprot:4293285-Pyramimonas_sp.AAC.1